ncbi:hypothetical protein FisN_35Hu007 [Fistulifera solaris]|uniref:Uncharacterized protein n=1 Tax=Fistulifera solaris TaxID=1519565 RepID=A0A1Z5JRB1_FISSO|nr:hypothetical protein FisN_35Hu007 [Fistulifera solaris]|eukprot:GAX16308.1 hypothetical protein FisN_35Hu007 [Fistulifera solaris]
MKIDFKMFNPEARPLPTRNIKWSLGRVNYEFAFPYLSQDVHSFSDFMSHLDRVFNGIRNSVDTDDQFIKSCWIVFGRTLDSNTYSSAYQSVETQVLTQNNFNKSKQFFDEVVRLYVKEFFQDTHQARLVEEVRNPEFPTNGYPVDNFYLLLMQANQRIERIPGPHKALDEAAFKTAFFNSMPPAWRDRWIAFKGTTALTDFSTIEIKNYMSTLQRLAQAKTANNNAQATAKPSGNGQKNSSGSGHRPPTKDSRAAKHKYPPRMSHAQIERAIQNSYAWDHKQDPKLDCELHPKQAGKEGHKWFQCNMNPNKAKGLFQNVTSKLKVAWSGKNSTATHVAETMDTDIEAETLVTETIAPEDDGKVAAINDAYSAMNLDDTAAKFNMDDVFDIDDLTDVSESGAK